MYFHFPSTYSTWWSFWIYILKWNWLPKLIYKSLLLTFFGDIFSKFHYIYQKLFLLLSKNTHTLSFIRISSTYAHLWMKYKQRSYFFSIFIANKVFKIFFTKRNLISITVLSISLLFIEIGLLCWWNLYFSVSVSSNLIIFYPLLYMVLIFFIMFLIYYFPLFLFKLVFLKSIFV